VKYAQIGDELRIERTLTGMKGTLPASRRMEVVEFLRRIGSDESKLIAIKGAPHSIALID
jgi:hypothetical protein